MRGAEAPEPASANTLAELNDERVAGQAAERDASSSDQPATEQADRGASAANLRAAAQHLETVLSLTAGELPGHARRALAKHLAGIKARLAQIEVAQLPPSAGADRAIHRFLRNRVADCASRARHLGEQAWRFVRDLLQPLPSTGSAQDGAAYGSFVELLSWHLQTGTRPAGPKKRWTNQEFAVALHPKGGGANTDESARKSVKNWLNGSAFPSTNYFASIELALFGADGAARRAPDEAPDHSVARAQFRAVYHRDREKRKNRGSDAKAAGRLDLPRLAASLLSNRPSLRFGAAISSIAAVLIGIVVTLARPSPVPPQSYQSERHIGGFFSLDDLLRSRRFINLDCGYRAIQVGGLEYFKKAEAYRTFVNAIAFRVQGPVPMFLAGLAGTLHSQSDPESRQRLAALALGVADKFYPLLLRTDLPTREYEKLYDAAQQTLTSAIETLNNRGAGSAVWRSFHEEEAKWAAPPPRWCEPKGEISLSAEEFKTVAKGSRSAFNLVAGLYVFGNAIDKATDIAEKARQLLGEDMNVNAALAELLALNRKDTEKLDQPTYARVHRLLERALKQALDQQRVVNDFSPGDSAIDQDIKQRLAERYKRAVLDIKLEIAFFLANEDSRDGWTYAEAFVEENLAAYKAEYEDRDQNKLKRFPCLDNFLGASILDTYGFVKLTALARDQYMDRRHVRDAIQKLEEAKALIDKIDDERCFFSDGRRKASWTRRVERHLDWAANLLASSRPAL